MAKLRIFLGIKLFCLLRWKTEISLIYYFVKPLKISFYSDKHKSFPNELKFCEVSHNDKA